MTSNTPPLEVLTVPKAFALTLETACKDFEVLQRLIANELKIVASDGREDHFGAGSIRMALAKSFVFHVARAHRICHQGQSELAVSELECTTFKAATAAVVGVRHVNEHGFDVTRNWSKPSLHINDEGTAFVDELSLEVTGVRKIRMGPIDLCDVYVSTDRMRGLAGF